MLISLIIPCYNSQDFILDTLISINNQTHRNFELIIIDDGSTDNTINIINNFKFSTYISTKIISKLNSGVSDTRNLGIKHSTGDYVVFIDSDDMVHSQFLELLNTGIKDSNVDFCFCKFSTNPKIVSDSFLITSFKPLNSFDVIKSIILKKIHNVSFFCFIYKKSIIINEDISFPKNLKYAEDHYFMFSYLSTTYKGLYINYPLYFYRKNPQSAMNKVNLNQLDSIIAIDNIDNLLTKKNHKLSLLYRTIYPVRIRLFLFKKLYNDHNFPFFLKYHFPLKKFQRKLTFLNFKYILIYYVIILVMKTKNAIIKL